MIREVAPIIVPWSIPLAFGIALFLTENCPVWMRRPVELLVAIVLLVGFWPEALIGAVYVDGGFDAAKGVVLRLMENSFDAVLSGSGVSDYKTRLQEYYHKKGISDIRYVVYREEGPPHDKVFYVKLFVAGEEISQGKGRSKKAAEQKAARQACLNVKE